MGTLCVRRSATVRLFLQTRVLFCRCHDDKSPTSIWAGCVIGPLTLENPRIGSGRTMVCDGAAMRWPGSRPLSMLQINGK